MTQEKEIPADVLKAAAQALAGRRKDKSDWRLYENDARDILTAIDYCGLVEENRRLREALEGVINRLQAELLERYPSICFADCSEWVAARSALANEGGSHE